MRLRNSLGRFVEKPLAGGPNRRMQVARAIQRCHGNLQHVAHELGFARWHIYRLIKLHKLWPVVLRARKKRRDHRRLIERHGRRLR